jgi:hypothetical protein
MGHRFLIFSLTVITVIIIFLLISGSPPNCTDPSGCLVLRPGANIEIGVGVMSSGVDRPVSLEVRQGAELAANQTSSLAGPALAIQPFFSPCLPGEPTQSSIDLTAANQLALILGPTCLANAEDFFQRAERSGKVVISPLLMETPASPGILSYSLDRTAIIRQITTQLSSLGYTKFALIPAQDVLSQDFATNLCDELQAFQLECGDTASAQASFDALLVVSMDQNTPISDLIFQDWPSTPAILVSMTLPRLSAARNAPTDWIGPSIWNEIRAFSAQYQAAFQAAPFSLAAWASYQSVSLAGHAIAGVVSQQWDGSWILPMTALKEQVISEGKRTSLFSNTCQISAGSCDELPLSLYQFTGKEYRLSKP